MSRAVIWELSLSRARARVGFLLDPSWNGLYCILHIFVRVTSFKFACQSSNPFSHGNWGGRQQWMKNNIYLYELESKVGFCGEGNTSRSTRRKTTKTNKKLDPHTTPIQWIDPGPHWWKVSALSTAPSPLLKWSRGLLGRSQRGTGDRLPSQTYILMINRFRKFTAGSDIVGYKSGLL